MCHQPRVTHFLTTIAGFRVVVALNLETAPTFKHIESYIRGLRQKFTKRTSIELIQQEIRITYPNCTFPSRLSEIASAYRIL